jgi:hypothetical protein
LVIVSALVLGGILGEILELSSGAKQVVYPEGLLLGVVSVLCHEDVINHSCPSLILKWLQGDSRENGSDTKWRADAILFFCFLFIHGLK